MAFQIYRSDDAGAPSVVGNTGLAGVITLFDACLVNGYGSKPSLGWTKPFSGTKLAAYLMGGTGPKAYLKVDHVASPVNARVLGYVGMTDINTGIEPFPTDVQLSGGCYINLGNSPSASIRPWIIYGNERFFYYHIWGGAAGATLSATSSFDNNSYTSTGFFGAFISSVAGDAYPFVLQAPNSTVSMSQLSQGSGMFAGAAGLYAPRNYLQQASTPRNLGKGTLGYSSAGGLGSASWPIYPDVIANALQLWPGMLLSEQTGGGWVVRGRCPAFIAPLNDMYTVKRYFDTLSDAAGNQYWLVPESNVIVVQTSPVHPDWALI